MQHSVQWIYQRNSIFCYMKVVCIYLASFVLINRDWYHLVNEWVTCMTIITLLIAVKFKHEVSQIVFVRTDFNVCYDVFHFCAAAYVSTGALLAEFYKFYCLWCISHQMLLHRCFCRSSCWFSNINTKNVILWHVHKCCTLLWYKCYCSLHEMPAKLYLMFLWLLSLLRSSLANY